MEKRMIVAIALSLLVLLGFQNLEARRRASRPPREISTSAVESAPVSGDREQRPEVDYGAGRIRNEMPLREKVTEIQTEKYTLVFSDIGGSLKKLSFNEYYKKKKEEVLFDEERPAGRLFAIQSGILAGLEKKRFQKTEHEGFLEYRLTDPGWVEVTKRYTFHNTLDYIELEVSVENLSPRKIIFSYQITGPSRFKKASQIAGRSFLEADTMIDGKLWKIRSVKGAQERTGNISWLGLKNRHFALILKPFHALKSVVIKQAESKDLLTALNSRDYELRPGEKVENKYLLYAGPLEEKRIAALGQDMESIVDYGFFGGLSKMLLSVLRVFYKGTKNWGIAIILLTILINVILFPLTFKSFSSMHQMKKVQPHIQKLKELHKDNPQKLNKETMELYKKYNINPLGGCLPMLLQMPIFIALYQGLMRSVELKGAEFLWIKDLAKSDAVSLPFSLPLVGAHLNILPLLMVGCMVLQQRISQGMASMAATDEQASQQRLMMIIMPLFFGFLFYKMPSGLVLYWLTNTVLMTLEQSFISRRMSRD
ncbi:MAG: hypothetical protein DRP85_03850 [Candidatus Makaraimicrobium thalassicum]|nr:MAG: hypothetical protein DRP85_03850 [Candidatus Omnitrophota bacterium]